MSSLTCQRCNKPLPMASRGGNTDRGLTVALSGSYGEFYDSIEGPRYVDLCHECGHALTDLLGLDTTGWHSERAIGLSSGEIASTLGTTIGSTRPTRRTPSE